MQSRPTVAKLGELILRSGDWIRRVPLDKQQLVLGRSRDCDVQLVDPKISRRHCRLMPSEDGTWLAEDLGSRTGTLLDGLPLHGPTPMQPGGRLQLGSTEAHIELWPAPAFVLSGAVRDQRSIELVLRKVEGLHTAKDLGELLQTIENELAIVETIAAHAALAVERARRRQDEAHREQETRPRETGNTGPETPAPIESAPPAPRRTGTRLI